ncbi:MAG: hypothetical protein AAF394_01715 [Planctomycetota bacterium]
MAEADPFEFEKRREQSAQSPLTITLLFYIVTMGGIVSACLATLSGNENVTVLALAAALGVGATIGIMLGVFVGLFYFRRVRDCGVSAVVGAGVGLVAGGLSLVSSEDYWTVASLSFVGCWLLALLMLASARFRK